MEKRMYIINIKFPPLKQTKYLIKAFAYPLRLGCFSNKARTSFRDGVLIFNWRVIEFQKDCFSGKMRKRCKQIWRI